MLRFYHRFARELRVRLTLSSLELFALDEMVLEISVTCFPI